MKFEVIYQRYFRDVYRFALSLAQEGALATDYFDVTLDYLTGRTDV